MDNVIIMDKLDDLSNVSYSMNNVVQGPLWNTVNMINQNTMATRGYLFDINLYQPVAKVSANDSNNKVLLDFQGFHLATSYNEKTTGIIDIPIGGTYNIVYNLDTDREICVSNSYITLYEILAIDSSTNYSNLRASTDFTTWTRNYPSYTINKNTPNVTIKKGKYKVKIGFAEKQNSNHGLTNVQFKGYYDTMNINEHPDYIYTITNASITNQQ